jgi:hypothetical protein
MLTLLMTGFALFVLWALWVYIVRPILEDTGLLAAVPDPDHSVKSAPVPAPARNAVFPDTYQAEPPANHPVLSSSEPVPNRDADIIYLARRVDESGAYVYSANKVAEFVGGQRSETLAKIRAARGEPEPAPDPATHIRVDGGRWITREG